jgi:LacI family transcriptional regulator
MRKQLVDGVIVSALPVDDPLVDQLIDNEVPFVMIGRPNRPAESSFVDVDNINGAHQAVNHLIRRGYQRIATITGPLNTTVGLDRRQGYLNALNERGLSMEPALMAEGDFTEVGGYMAMQRLLPYRPDAVFVASDTMALGALRALRNAGLAVPQEVALIGFDDLPTAAIADPPLTTIRQPIRQAGAQAVETLIDLLNNSLQPPRHIIMTTQLVIRDSCGSNL